MPERRRLEPARYAIVGSREYPHLDLVRAFVRKLPTGSVVVSGGARGVDSVAEEAARECGLGAIVIPADWSQGRGAGIARNADIVAAADIVVAFWDGKSRGTQNSMSRAVEAGKPLWVCGATRAWTFTGEAVPVPPQTPPPVAGDPTAPWVHPKGWGSTRRE